MQDIILVIRAKSLNAACELVRKKLERGTKLDDTIKKVITYWRSPFLTESLAKIGISKTKRNMGKLYYILVEWDMSTDISIIKMIIGSSPDAQFVTVVDAETFKNALNQSSQPTSEQVKNFNKMVHEFHRKNLKGSERESALISIECARKALHIFQKNVFFELFDPYASTLIFHDTQKPYK